MIAVLLLAAVAAAVRYIAMSYRGGYLGWDETMFLQMGRNLLTGKGYSLSGLPNITFPALPALIAAPIHMLSGNATLAFRIPAALFGGATVIPIYLLTRRMFSRDAGLAAAVVFAGFRPLLMFSAFCSYRHVLYSGSEPLFLFLTAWLLYFFWRAWRERRMLHAALAGLVCGIAFTARQEALVLCGALVVWLAAASLLDQRRLTRGLLARMGLVTALFLVGSAPWFLHGRSVTGHFMLGPHLSHNMLIREAFRSVYEKNDWKPYFQLHHALNAEKTEFESPYYGVAPYHRQAYRAHSNTSTFGDLLRGLNLGSLVLWARDMIFLTPLYAGGFLLLGLIERPRRETLVKLGFLLAVMAPAVTIALTLLVLPRYNVYTASVLVIFTGAGIAAAARLTARFTRIKPSIAVIVLALGVASAGAFQALRFNAATRATSHHNRHVERLMPLLAAEINSLAPPGTRILSHNPQIPFAAGGVWIPLPTERFEDIVTFARNKNAPLVILRKSDEALRSFSFEEALGRSDLVETLVRREFDGEEIAILRVRPLQPTPGPV